MRIDVSTEDTRFRMEVREWLNANAPRAPRPQGGPEMRDFDVAWRRRQYEGGYPHISWPAAYGGLGLSVIRQLIWYEEYARAGAPPGSDLFFVALATPALR